MMFHLFLLLLFLSPLPVCWVLYRHFKVKEDAAKLTVFNLACYQLTGVIVTYLICLIVNAELLYPHLLGLHSDTSKTEWTYHLSITQSSFDQTKSHHEEYTRQNGRLVITALGGDIIRINELSHQPLDVLNVKKYGLSNQKSIFIPLTHSILPNKNGFEPMVIAYGAFNHAYMTLHVYSLKDEESDPQLFIKGTLALTRVPPTLQLLALTLLPIVLLLLIHQISPLTHAAKKMHVTVSKGTPMRDHLSIEFSLTSVTVSYLAVYLMVFLIMNDISFTTKRSLDKESYHVCKVIEGKWHHKLYHYIPKKKAHRLDYTGGLHVACYEDMRKMTVHGFNNPTQAEYISPASCYQKRHISGESWEMNLVGIINRKLIGIYEVGSIKQDIGLISAVIHENNDEHVLNFYDFRDHRHYPKEKNNGKLALFKKELGEDLLCNMLARGS